MWIHLVILQVLFLAVRINCDVPEVTIADGTIQGSLAATVSGAKFFSYEGLPYAEPPVGHLRFQEPQPVKPWTGKWVARKPSACLQYEHAVAGQHYAVTGSEDCLYLNVYTPTVDSNSNLDVIVYIHGGAFMFGTSSMYRPDNILDANVVLVTINYRLGPLGFLSFEDKVLPGNNGLKDQSMALRWIQKNIHHFGGNPKSVTLIGSSAGGASVHLHYLSPMSKGLFARGISLSGSMLNPWPKAEASKEKALRLAAHVGCSPSAKPKEIVECLRGRPAEQIVQSVELFLGFLYNPYSPFGLVVEKDSKNPFLPDEPRKLLETGNFQQLPWIVSCTKDEGLYPAAEFMQSIHFLDEIDRRWVEVAPYILDYNYTVKNEDRERVANEIKLHYLRGERITKDTYDRLVQMMGDRLFNYGNYEAAKLQSKVSHSPVYFFQYNFRGVHSLSEKYSGKKDDFGTSHADDSLQLFGFFNEEDRPIRKVLIDIIKTFAKDSKPSVPNVEWKPVCDAKDTLTYLKIDSPEDIKLQTIKNFGDGDFWKTLPIDY